MTTRWLATWCRARAQGWFSSPRAGSRPRRVRAGVRAQPHWQVRPCGESLEPRQLLAASVVINEIHYHPDVKTDRLEFVELFNAGDAEVDLSQWRLTDGVEYEFPADTRLASGEYLVVAQDPQALATTYQVDSVGPFRGRLSNDGETILLVDQFGVVRDRVDYGNSFPWPIVGDSRDASIQLIHPSLDNDLAGSWRSVGGSDLVGRELLAPGLEWRYWKGFNAPASGWREVSFNDAQWSTGLAPLGYGEDLVQTVLSDMRGGYSSLYLRRKFTVVDPAQYGTLVLEALYDDGINVWLNGQLVASANTPGSVLSHTTTASSAFENLEFVRFELPAGTQLREGTNVLAVQLLNASLSGSSDAFIDARLVGFSGSVGESTPGRPNSVWAENAPPQLRQLRHTPEQPRSNEPVTVSIKATDPDGVQRLTLYYQVVAPGDYFSLNDPRYASQWTSLQMRDDGQAGDAVAGDDVYTAVLPAGLQQHRHLVRYRIAAEDTEGLQVMVPYADDPQPNFAYFVYDTIPDWTGAVRSGQQPVTYPSELLDSLPVYHLITTRQAHEDAMFIPNSGRNSGYTGSDYQWRGTFVYDGQVYDHIDFRARGGVWRYAMGKNMWKFNFLRGHRFQARDEFGRLYETEWDKLNFSAVIQQGNYLHRGEQGLFESVGFDLFNLAGVEAPHTHFVHFRIIEDANEGGPNQYQTDFQGLYLVIEQPDGRMLDEHHLPDGNFYKMEGGTGTLNNQGPDQPTDRSDLNAFLAAYQGSTQSEQWWRDNLDLERYYSYRSIVEAIHHYDIAGGKNYFYYANPETGRWQVHPWDLDLTWADNMFGTGQEPFHSRVAQRGEFAQEYRNRLREVLDLLYNSEQTGWLIDEKARLIYTPGENSWVDADRAMWDYNPILRSSYVNSNKAGWGRFYERSDSRDFAGMIQLMKDYVVSRTLYLERNVLTDAGAIPAKPSVSFHGPAEHPIDQLLFQSSPFSSPTNSASAGTRWRIAEVSGPGIERYDGLAPTRFEIQAQWESELLLEPQTPLQIPPEGLLPGRTYRVRVRQLDAAGRWSHWSDPYEFVAAPPQGAANLRITELYYHPTGPTPEERAELPLVDDEDFEFLELTNVGTQPVTLEGLKFVDGIGFDFADSAIHELAGGASLVLAGNRSAFELRFGVQTSLAGVYSGRLSNGGERLVLANGDGVTVLSLTYDDQGPWPEAADGGGPSLQLIDLDGDPNSPTSWVAATANPGTVGPPSATTFAGAGLFYSDSVWHQQHGIEGAAASDKRVAQEGDELTFSHLITAPEGVTGFWLDLAALPHYTQLLPEDFRFRTGAGAQRGDWQPAPAPINLNELAAVDRQDGTSRVTLTWSAGSVVNQWLEVTLLANHRTQLSEDLTLYVGSLVGETGNAAGAWRVDVDDFARIAAQSTSFLNPATIDSVFDLNRDMLVDGSDLAIARDNRNASLAPIDWDSTPSSNIR